MFPWLSMILINILSGDGIQNGRRYLTKSFETWGINSIKPHELCKFNHFHLIVFTRSIHTRYDICWLLRAYTTHQMEHFPRYLAFVGGIHRSHVDPPHKASGAELWVFFDLSMNKWLIEQSIRRWFEMSPRSLWRHCSTLRACTTYQREHFPRYLPFVRGIPYHQWIPLKRPVTRSFDVCFDMHLIE